MQLLNFISLAILASQAYAAPSADADLVPDKTISANFPAPIGITSESTTIAPPVDNLDLTEDEIKPVLVKRTPENIGAPALTPFPPGWHAPKDPKHMFRLVMGDFGDINNPGYNRPRRGRGHGRPRGRGAKRAARGVGKGAGKGVGKGAGKGETVYHLPGGPETGGDDEQT